MINIRNKIFLLLFLCIINRVFAQGDNFVKDEKLKSELRDYLIKNQQAFEIDSMGNKIIPKSDYGSIGITSRNLKTDSILIDKYSVGIYSFKFSCLDCESFLYFQYPNGNREYYNFFDKKFDVFKLMDRVESFLKKTKFSEKEKIKTMQQVLELMEVNRSYTWDKIPARYDVNKK